MSYHDPVLLKESIEALNIKADGIYVDATFGSGGHSAAILSKLKKGRLVVFDQDSDAVANAPVDERLLFVRHNFRYMKNFLRFLKIEKIDGLIADLGVSSHHFDSAERGFSFRFDTLLDMRMNSDKLVTAAHILNTSSEEHLDKVLRSYGELHGTRRMARAIIDFRMNNSFEKVADLTTALKDFIPRIHEHKFLAKVFQSLRIEVNDEMGALRDLLEQSAQCMKQEGRMVVISYHSLEDGLVKNFIRSGKFKGEAEKDFYGNVNTPFSALGKTIVPSESEIISNNRARSARMRVAIKN